jgi:TRAP-type uncharacterized transport system fused permease subunit
MGAAAFLMVEYVGISYVDVIKHAFLPALISYIALVYIVHLEALKANMQGLESSNPPKPLVRKVMGFLGGLLLMMVTALVVYYGLGWLKPVLGDATPWVVSVGLAVIYVALLKLAAGYPELELDDPNEPIYSLPQTRPTVLVGLQYILPVVVLVWCLMVERLSPGLSAFWATVFMVFIILTQRPITSIFRGRSKMAADLREGAMDLWVGLVTGARNMIGIGIATATAGIIVGAVSQTGVGPVIVQLGAENGLLVPLIAVHLFVFYFGIMADVTPPVGLASFAAAAVSGGDPIRTGFQAFYYSLRTAALPFLFIFNTDLLLIDVTFLQGILIFVVATIAMLIFAAATQGYMIIRSRWYESAALLLIAFTLFRPGFWMDMIHDPYQSMPPAQFVEALGAADEDSTLRLQIAGRDAYGDRMTTYMTLPVPDGDTGQERLDNLGMALLIEGDTAIVDMVDYGSQASDLGFDFDQEIIEVLAPVDRWTKELMWIPAFLVFGLVIMLQRRRRDNTAATATV